MYTLPKTLRPLWIVMPITAVISTLMMIELIQNPTLTLYEVLLEVIEPTLIVLTVTGVLYLLGRIKRQHREKLTLLRDVKVDRSEGEQ